MERCRLWLSKEEIDPELLQGKTAVIIDALLATTTLITMMERGAKYVYPVDSIEASTTLREELLLEGSVIRGGEQGGRPVDEFDLGHLPTDYTEDVVSNQRIVFLSTNGTKAIQWTAAASKRLLCSFRNVHYVADYIQRSDPEELVIVCSGAGSHFSMEDYLCASRLIAELNLDGVKLDDGAILASEGKYSDEQIVSLVTKSRVGRSMVNGNMQDLLDFVLGFRTQDVLVEATDEGILAVLEKGEVVHE
ncbi:2-phosphosulfolactate phosphatase [Geomicrobium sediminis]|uniref:Probable 2-phosphosulfolactate phosphatase n=1 Tax=Geomicrobium sediminis TaxID=1347788 RepID=A0ABS2P7U6_9BACL|nr:2-phosphosulfolactate phosphatase [Geomicrobium sediminis]